MDIIKDSISFAFKDKDWIKKFGISALIVYITGAINMAFSFIFVLPIQMMAATSSSYNGYGSGFASGASVMTNLLSGLLSLLMLPVSLYLFGYFFELVKNVVKGDSTPSPLHDNIGKKFLKGALLYVLSFLSSLPVTIIGVVMALIAGLGVYIISPVMQGDTGSILTILLVLLGTVFFIALMILNALIYLSAAYLFVTTDSFGQAISPTNIIRIIKLHYKELFAILGYQFLLSFIAVIAFMLSAITLFLAIPALSMLLYFASAYIYGVYFKKIKEVEEGKK